MMNTNDPNEEANAMEAFVRSEMRKLVSRKVMMSVLEYWEVLFHIN